MKNDWYDMLSYQGSYKYPYRIQWCRISGKVRAKANSSDCWAVENCCVKAEYALTIGQSLLTKGESYGKVQKA